MKFDKNLFKNVTCIDNSTESARVSQIAGFKNDPKNDPKIDPKNDPKTILKTFCTKNVPLYQTHLYHRY